MDTFLYFGIAAILIGAACLWWLVNRLRTQPGAAVESPATADAEAPSESEWFHGIR